MQDDLDTGDSQPGADVTADSPLPDIPDAGPDSQPIVPPEPVDISTATLVTDSALVAGTFGDPRTMYEQALDAYEASDGAVPADAQPDPSTIDTSVATPAVRRARIYNSQT